MLHDCELATLMAAAGRAVEGEFRADVQAQLRLVVNAHEPHLASLNHGDGLPGAATRSARQWASQDAPERGDVAEVPLVGEHDKLVLSASIRGGYPVVARSCSWCP